MFSVKSVANPIPRLASCPVRANRHEALSLEGQFSQYRLSPFHPSSATQTQSIALSLNRLNLMRMECLFRRRFRYRWLPDPIPFETAPEYLARDTEMASSARLVPVESFHGLQDYLPVYLIECLISGVPF